jgi:hypothetical protein
MNDFPAGGCVRQIPLSIHLSVESSHTGFLAGPSRPASSNYICRKKRFVTKKSVNTGPYDGLLALMTGPCETFQYGKFLVPGQNRNLLICAREMVVKSENAVELGARELAFESSLRALVQPRLLQPSGHPLLCLLMAE